MITFDAADVVELTPELGLLATVGGRILSANQAVARAIGVSKSSLADSELTAIAVDPKDRLLSYLTLCARTRERMPGALTLRTAEGQTLEYRCEGSLFRPRSDSSQAIVFLVCRSKEEAVEQFVTLNEKIAALSREVAERKRAEEERDELLTSERAARAEAERVNRLKDEFLATLSHELRTPLNAILGWAQVLAMKPPSEADLKLGLEVIERNTRVQSQLVEDLLDMSRIISGKVRLDVQRVQLAAVIEAAIEAVQPAVNSKGLRLQKVLDPLTDVVSGDPNRLQQVFWNLLSNAAKFTPKGGRIQVLLERVNSHIEVSVIDTGEGIKPEFLPHVFSRFQQADSSTTRRYGGLGLGLAIARHLVELHGGTIRAKSAGEGKGATFVVQLPLMAIHEEDPQAPRRHPRAPVPAEKDLPPRLTGLKILVVDDEPDALAMVKRLLEFCECSATTADNAADALEAVKRVKPDVLISDIGMPGEDGYALLAKVRSLPPQEGGTIPAIALTAFARSDDRRKAMLAGFQMHMAKPVESAELVAVIANVTGLTMRKPG